MVILKSLFLTIFNIAFTVAERRKPSGRVELGVLSTVIPAQAGIHFNASMDSRLRGSD